ncbi:MAG: DUF91 domain-containing protein [Deltaproteobacteria bacterium]|nr:DUF91 domain-containing protein [Deltaproteobacteria bacterium]
MAGHGYDKTIKMMMNDFCKVFNLEGNNEVTSDQILNWFKQKYPKVKESSIRAHLVAMSTNAKSRIHHKVRSGSGHDLFYQIDSRTYRLYNSKNDPAPIYKQDDFESLESKNDENNDEPVESSQFGFEKDLQNFLVKNLYLIEPNLKLYENEGITGVEYPVGNRFLDILAISDSNELVVIELKVSKGYDRVVGQLLRYMAWIEKNLADEGQKVRGVIIAKQISEDLKLACSKIADVKLMEYELSVKLSEVNSI